MTDPVYSRRAAELARSEQVHDLVRSDPESYWKLLSALEYGVETTDDMPQAVREMVEQAGLTDDVLGRKRVQLAEAQRAALVETAETMPVGHALSLYGVLCTREQDGYRVGEDSATSARDAIDLLINYHW